MGKSTHSDESEAAALTPEIVAIGLGAAQRGHRLLREFLRRIPWQSQGAFVVAYHAAQQEQLTANIEASTALPIRRIKNHMPVTPATIFVAPRKAVVTLRDGKFRVSLKDEISTSIDTLFESLAEHSGAGAVAVLLADEMEDGRAGLKAVRKAGGLALHGGNAESLPSPGELAQRVLARLGATDVPAVPAQAVKRAPASGAIADSVADMLRDLQLRERALASVACGIVIVDMIDERQPITYVNEGFERLTGYTLDESQDRNCRFLQGPDTDPESVTAIREAIEARNEAAITLLNYRKDGTPFYNELRLTPVRDERDVTTHYVGVQTDVTSRVEAEQALRESEAKIRALLDSTAEAIYGLDLEGNCTFCNPACVKMLGYERPEDLIGRNMHEFVHHSRPDGSLLEERDCVLFRAFRDREPAHSVTEYFWRKDGTGFAVECWSYPIYREGEVTGAVVTFLDISSRIEAAEALLKRTRTLERINRINVSLTAELDLNKLVKEVVEAGREIVGAQIGAFFYNVVEDSGDSYMLFALSGATDDDFDGMPMPRKTEIFEPTFSGRAVIRADDITKDARYGKNAPFAGMPAGHPPVRSFLSTPVISRTGTVLGGLLFGHAEAGVFDQDDEDILTGLAAQAAVAIDNARLFEAAQREINERKQAEKALEEARHAADRANESKSAFLANMSHEIRTPMTAILGYADILAAHLRDPDNRECVETIKRNGRFLLDIVDDILDLSRIEAGELRIEPTRIGLAELMADVRSLMEVRAQEKQLPLMLEYRGRIPEHVETDPTRLRQILINLLSNAIKFTADGSIRLIVEYREEAAGDAPVLCFDVIDTGIGMSGNQIEQVFQPFRQADDSITRRYGGTGLGLSISQRLAHMLGGRIEVESTPGAGSRFRLTLPTERVDEDDLVRPALDIDDAMPLEDDLRGRLSGRVLVVDDRRDIRYLAQYFLEEAGARVTTAENGRAALDVVKHTHDRGEHFDLILMDMQMPVLDGFAATKQLRESGYERPIVALTAGALNADRESCLAVGCDEHIAKPIEGPRLVRIVAEYLSETQSERHAKPVEPAQAGSPADAPDVLLVDDNEDSCRALGKLLELRGYRVGLAFDGRGALEAAQQAAPRVVILDLGLPDISGFDVAEKLRALPGGERLRIVALSGQQLAADQAREAGFDDFALKPAGVEDLERLLGSTAEERA